MSVLVMCMSVKLLDALLMWISVQCLSHPLSPVGNIDSLSVNLINENKYYPQRPTLQKNDSIWVFCCSDLCFFLKLFSSSWCTKASIVIIYCYLAPLRHSIAIHSTMPSNSHLPVSACMCWNCSYVSPYLTLSFLKSVSVSRQGELYVLSEAGSRFAHLPRTRQNM